MHGERRNQSRDFERLAQETADYLKLNGYSCQLYANGVVECTQRNECILFKPDDLAYQQARQLAEGKLSQSSKYTFARVLSLFGKVS